VLEAEGTLHTWTEGKVKSVVFVDEKAGESQARALVEMARALGGERLSNVVKVEKAPISYSRKGDEAQLAAGKSVRVKTMSFCDADHICCHEEQAYPAISASTRVMCVKTAEHQYQGDALGERWSDPNRRSSMVGRFEK
jgi:hypothetical protein